MAYTYKNITRLVSHLGGYEDLKGIQLLIRKFHAVSEEAHQKPQQTIWTNVAMPQEIFYAMGLPTLYQEYVSVWSAAALQAPQLLDATQEKISSVGLCTVATTAIGVLAKKFAEPPAAFVTPSVTCEDIPKVFEYLARTYQKPYYFVDVPYGGSDDAVDYVAEQLREMVPFLERHTGTKLEPEKLSKALELSNDAQRYFALAGDLRKESPFPLMRGVSGLFLSLGIYCMFGSEEGVEICKCLFHELRQRREKNASPLKNKSYRILWKHLYPIYSKKLIRYVEDELDCAIVGDEFQWWWRWPEYDGRDPFRGIARRLLTHRARGTFAAQMNYLVDLALELDVDGVIQWGHQGCRLGRGVTSMLSYALRERGIPSIELCGDSIDCRSFSEAQLMTRLEAFVEMLAKGSRQRKNRASVSQREHIKQ